MDKGWRKIVCVAGGPSFDVQQAALIQEARYANLCHVIVVNRAWERIPNADVLYAADEEFWDTYWTKIQFEFRNEKYTASADAARRYNLQKVRAKNHRGIEFDTSTRIVTGLHSGQQAMNLAYHFGAAQIILVGYDMCGPGYPYVGRNWHDPYPTAHMNRLHNYSQWRDDMADVAEYFHDRAIDVVNCSNVSALTCFRRGDLKTELGL